MNRKFQYDGVKKWIVNQGCRVAFMLWLIGSGAADAHYVSLFAWVDGDTVYTESKFGGG